MISIGALAALLPSDVLHDAARILGWTSMILGIAVVVVYSTMSKDPT